MAKIISVRSHWLFFSKAALDPVQSCGHWNGNTQSFGLKVGCAATCCHGPCLDVLQHPVRSRRRAVVPQSRRLACLQLYRLPQM